MENDNLLQRCETLEADFNALDTYFKKRDFVKQFLEDVEPNIFNYVREWYFKENDSQLEVDIVKAQKDFFKKSEDAPAIKIRQDACNKAKELFRKEFKKIEPELILKVAEKLVIELYKTDFNNDYKELEKFANLLRLQPQQAHEMFYTKLDRAIYSNKIDCEKYYFEVYDKYKTQNEFEANNVEFMDSILNDTFFNEYQINNEALAANLLSFTASILNNEPTPPTTTETPTGGKEADDLDEFFMFEDFDLRPALDSLKKDNQKILLLYRCNKLDNVAPNHIVQKLGINYDVAKDFLNQINEANYFQDNKEAYHSVEQIIKEFKIPYEKLKDIIK